MPVKLLQSLACQVTGHPGSIPELVNLSQFFKHRLIDLFLLLPGTPTASLLRGKSSSVCAGILIHMGGARRAQFVNHLPKTYDA